jgi:hypothetical protein
MKTKIEILDDVVLHIKKQGGQAIDLEIDICSYLTEDGKTCGHSMAVNPVKRKLLKGELCAKTVINEYGDNVHLVKYRGHSVHFWGAIQLFHDTTYYWNEDGSITGKGTSKLQKLKETYLQD